MTFDEFAERVDYKLPLQAEQAALQYGSNRHQHKLADGSTMIVLESTQSMIDELLGDKPALIKFMDSGCNEYLSVVRQLKA